MLISMWVSPRRIVLATIAAGVLLLSVFTGLGYQSYSAVQDESVTTMSQATTAVENQLASIESDTSSFEAAIAQAESILDKSAGKTLDETTRTALLAAIADARTNLDQQDQRTQQLRAAFELASLTFPRELLWPPKALQTALALSQNAGEDGSRLASLERLLDLSVTAVKKAETAWQAEQDRLAAVAATVAAEAAAEAAAHAAADAAARLAAPRNIPSVSTITESGGSTAPSAPAAPAAVEAPVAGFDIEGYVYNLAPNSYISWVDALCDGYYVCGRAWVGGVTSTPVKIELDPALKDIYANRTGISVLVHEAAHARQWLYYGSDIIPANERLTGLSGPPAVEYMADCATIGKLGYSTGTYTSSCTPDQMDAAALIW